jgi:molybdopterin synthase sulfur carrier subunit
VAVVFLPTPMRKHADGAVSIDVPGATLRELIDNLDARYPGLKAQLIDPELEGRVIRSLSAIVDGEAADMGLRTRIDEGSEVHFLAAIAGGAPSEEAAR